MQCLPGHVNSHSNLILWPHSLVTGKCPGGSPTVHLESTSPDEAAIQNAEIIWDYMKLHHTLEKADLLLILGNNDVRVATYAASLWLKGYAKWIMFSGNVGNMTTGKWTKSEAEVFCEIALGLGVPEDKILLETKATNTGENIRYSYNLLKEKNLLPIQRIMLVQTPYMERRTYATFMKQWPGDTGSIKVLVTSPPLTLQKYPNEHVGSLSQVIAVMLGCLQRVKHYPKTGFQIYQDIPNQVWAAYQYLKATGNYSDYLCYLQKI